MKKTALAAVLAIAALSASACTGGTSTPSAAETPADSAPIAHESTTAPAAPSTAPASSTPADESRSVEPDFADAAMRGWLSTEGAHSLEGFSEPYSLITGWTSPDHRTIDLTVSDDVEDLGKDPEKQLDLIAAELLTVVNRGNHAAKAITATTEDGEHSATVRHDEARIVKITG